MLNTHAYKPGVKDLVYANMISSLVYLIQEFIITIKLGITEEKKSKEGIFERIKKISSFNSKIALGLAIF